LQINKMGTVGPEDYVTNKNRKDLKTGWVKI